MRSFTIGVVFLMLSAVNGQTVVSVQNGLWTSSSTWDCACVPDFSQNVVIMHSVEIDVSLLIGHQQVQVTSSGEITMTLQQTVSFNTVLINEGHVLVMGDVLNSGLFNNAGLAEFVGRLLNDGSIISDSGALLRVEGDFVNQDLVQGEGAICVSDLTDNQGAISGTLDFCDQTPSVSVPPFIDQNTGAVENGITFCQNSPCASSINEPFGATLELSSSIVTDQVILMGIPKGATFALMDAIGRMVLPARTASVDRVELGLSGLPIGVYRLVVAGSSGQRMLPLVIAR